VVVAEKAGNDAVTELMTIDVFVACAYLPNYSQPTLAITEMTTV